MHWSVQLRRLLARAVLRGGLLVWWLRRMATRLERQYLAELVKNSERKPAGELPPPRGPSAPLRRMLFVADVQWELNELIPELRKIAEVQVLNLHAAMVAAEAQNLPSETTARSLEEYLKKQNLPDPDLIFFYARPGILSDESFDLLRKKWSCPLLGMNLDDKIEFLDYGVFSSQNDNYRHWARRFDLNLSNVRAVADWYADNNLPVMFFPEGFYPKYDQPPRSIAEFSREFSFLGRCRPERGVFIDRLRECGVPIETRGGGWPGSAEVARPEEYFRSSQINLGIGWAAPSETLTTLKGRDFECPGAGGCYLTTYNWELAAHFDIGREILCYRSEAECVELFSYYRRRPYACLQIGQAAFRRSLAEHTWEIRFRKVFQQMGFKA